MSSNNSALHLSVCAALLFAGACHGGHSHPKHDSSIDPVGSGDAGTVPVGMDSGANLFITADFNTCPRTGMIATPLEPLMDQPVLLQSTAVDPDGESLTYEWVAEPDGTFDDKNGQSPMYHCASIGRKTLYMNVTDKGGCESSDSIEVSCVNVADFVNSGTQQLPTMP